MDTIELQTQVLGNDLVHEIEVYNEMRSIMITFLLGKYGKVFHAEA